MNSSKYSLLKRVGLVFTIITFIVLYSALMTGFSSRPFEKPVNWKHAILESCLGWYVWAFVVPLAVWLSNRYTFIQKRFWKSIFYVVFYMFLFLIAKSFYNETVLSRVQDFPHFEKDPLLQRVVGMFFSFRIFVETVFFLVILTSVYIVKYLQIIQEREIQARQLETELVEARLNSLQMQLQPHFLFNTLNSISSLLREKLDFPRLQENVRSADKMITNLSEMFRHTLKTIDVQEVPLRDELFFLDNYIDIEKIRFADRLSIEKHIQPQLEAALVPAFFLQPLVENAIRHGIARLTRQGVVRILIQKKEGRIEFIVQDNGPCSADELKIKSDRGIGLSNIRKRLQHLYGDAYSFEMRKNSNRETEILVSIPCQVNRSTNGLIVNIT
jgi:two-component system, LytTR family, sensor kinase